MGKRMDKYEHIDEDNVVPKRSEKNKELYKQIYNAYDEFENLVVPSNAKEIDINDLNKEISSRDDYRQLKDVETVINTRVKRIDTDDIIEKKEENSSEEVYDINELLDKAVSSNKKEATIEPTLSSGDYLKKLKIDRTKTNLEQVKEMYNSMEDDIDNNVELLKTANLSLEILSDLKGTDDNTAVSAVNTDEVNDIVADVVADKEDEEEKTTEEDYDFYSNNYKFSKRDFDGKNENNIDKKILKKVEEEKEEDEENDDEDEDADVSEGGSFLKIFFLIFGILLVVAIVAYLIIYFGSN